MNVLIVEDEELAVRKLRKLITEIDPTLQIQGVTGSIEDSVAWLRENTTPELIFMDIELADGQSFEIFNHVEVKSHVIFTTSYDEYIMPAFRINSIDYLLKPILKEDLKRSLGKLLHAGNEHEPKSTNPVSEPINIKKLLGELQNACKSTDHGFTSRFLAKQGQKMICVEAEDILYFYAEGHSSCFMTKKAQQFQLHYNLDELASMLDSEQFYRVNETLIVTKAGIEKIHAFPGNRLTLILKLDFEQQILLNSAQAADFRNWMSR